MKISAFRSLSSISTDLTFGEGFEIRIPHLNDLCFLFLESLGAAAQTVLTELHDQKLFSRGMASIKRTASDIC